MSALPSRVAARLHLQVKLAEALPGVEVVSTTTVRCRAWDGRQNNAAFCFVVLLEDGAPVGVALRLPGAGRLEKERRQKSGARRGSPTR